MNQTRPLLLLEINEVPWRLIDRFGKDYPHIDLFFSQAVNHTSIAVDEGELSPWITWPTLHRGMPGKEHHVLFLGQDPSTFAGVPIWEEFRKRQLSIGICGSLQSWPPTDPGAEGFFIPDTFASNAACIPPRLQAFQRLNLKLVKENSRTISDSVPFSRELLDFAAALPRLGISAKTILRTFSQLGREKISPHYVARRPVFQAMLLWDIFKNLYRVKSPPAFSTFFTNHIASLMHRYWQDSFPEDFAGNSCPEHQQTMRFGLRLLDEILKDALKMIETNPQIILVFASSMGQGPKVWKDFDGYSCLVRDSLALLRAVVARPELWEGASVQPLLAMAPQTALQIPHRELREACVLGLESCRSASGARLFSVSSIDDRISISLHTPDAADRSAGSFSCGDRKVSWAAAGIAVEKVSPASAYHVPEGIFSIVDRQQAPNASRDTIAADKINERLLQLSGMC